MPKQKILKYALITGCFIIKITLGVDWYFGNLSTYTNSYFRYYVGQKAYDINPEWLLSTFLISYTIGILTMDFLRSAVGVGLVQLVSLVVLDSALLVTYFTVQYSVGLVLVTLMMCGGYTVGVTSMVCLRFACLLMPKRVGLSTGILTSAVGIGASFYNYVITYYINPDNVTPDVLISNMKYFSKAKILDKVPGAFIVIGVLTTVMNSLGYVLVRIPLSFLGEMPNTTAEETHIGQNLSKYCEEGQSKSFFEDSHHELGKIDSNNVHSSPRHEEPHSITTSEVLMTKSFYLMWTCRFVLSYCHVLYQNYYKVFGQLWIDDDKFLASVGSLVSFGNIFCRIACGLAIDKFGVRNTMVASVSVNTVLLSWWFLAPRFNRWLFFVCCEGLVGVQGSVFALFPMAALKLYGPKHYPTNYGLILVATISACLSCPILFALLQQPSGGSWYSLVLLGSGGSTLTLAALVLAMPDER